MLSVFVTPSQSHAMNVINMYGGEVFVCMPGPGVVDSVLY